MLLYPRVGHYHGRLVRPNVDIEISWTSGDGMEDQSLLDSAYLFVVGVKIEVVIVMRVHPYRYRADAEWCNPGTR